MTSGPCRSSCLCADRVAPSLWAWQPEAVAEHRDRVTLMAVMARVRRRSVLVVSSTGGSSVVMLVVCVPAGLAHDLTTLSI